MAKVHHPHRGSLGFSPRKRAASPVPKIKSYPEVGEAKLLGFAGYKAGMTHVIIKDDREHSITHGEEIARAVTVIEAPPLGVYGIRLYGKNTYGKFTLTEYWLDAENLPKHFLRAAKPPKNRERKLEDLEGYLDRTVEVRALVYTQPWLTGIGKKKPELMEYPIGGNIQDAFNFIKEKLGGEIRAKDVFQEGEYIDVMAVTKGKGFQSPVRRWGVKILPRKTRKGRRTAGTLGPWHPSAMMWTVPQSGQMGYHHRTEYNKRILMIGTKDEEEYKDITPKGGFLHYGIVKNDYILVDGSVPGPKKRLIRMRPAIRIRAEPKKPEIVHISLESKQGA